MEGNNIFRIMNQIKRRVFRRKILATLFLIVISILFLWSIKKDMELKRFGKTLEQKKMGLNTYLLDLNSFDVTNNTVKGTLTLQPGFLISTSFQDFLKNKHKERTIYYGPLRFYDFSRYPWFPLGLQQKSTISYSTISPSPINISIKAIGNPENYPFDKYLIMGNIICPAYFEEENKKIYVDSIENGESLAIRNLMTGLFIRYPTSREYEFIKMESNNLRNNFALIVERPPYLKLMTIILVVFALLTSFYIGFKSTSENLIIQIIGYLVSLWGIRSIILSDTKILISYFDYTMLFAYLVLFTGIIFRMIRGDLTNFPRKQ